MKINEVEKMLEVPKATIRFYEKEGLLSPQRKENSYRDYSDADVERLKKIIVFRKVGMPVDAIKQVLQDALPLQEALTENMSSLHEQIKELEGALHLCKLICKNNEDINSFDEDYYWDAIHAEEQKGNKFFAIVNDVIDFEKRVIADEFGLLDRDGNLRYSLGKSILSAGITCVICGLTWFFLDGRKPWSFLQGFFIPFSWILISSVVGLPVFFLEKKNKKAAKIVKYIGMGLVVVLFIALLLLVIFAEEV